MHIGCPLINSFPPPSNWGKGLGGGYLRLRTTSLGSMSSPEAWVVHAEVEGKVMTISVGDATQSIRWLGAVAISRWDDKDYEGWRRLGVPTSVTRKDSETPLHLDSSIRDCLKNGDTVVVRGSLSPQLT